MVESIRKCKIRSDKGIFFSIDSILALSIIIAIISGVGIHYSLTSELNYQGLHSEAEDLMTVLSTTEAGDMERIKDLNYVHEEDYNKTVLELIGSFWTSGNKTTAGNLTETVLSNITEKCWELDFSDTTIENNDCNNPETMSVANRIASGYERTEQEEGYVTRGILSQADSKLERSYIFFGGYVGDGNITKNITLSDVDSVLNVTMEMDVGGNFSLWVNGNSSGSYTPSSSGMRSDIWKVSEEYWSNFEEGDNKIWFNFTQNRSHISGGLFEVTYNTTGFEYFEEAENSTRYDFPGIDGVINLYSSFYVPGQVQNASAKLHYRSNYTTFMKVGNATVYNGSAGEGEDTTVSINSSEFRSRLNSSGYSFSDISKETVPLRFGIMNISYILNEKEADVFSVTDISGSMGTCDVPADENDYDCTNTCVGYDSSCCYDWFWYNCDDQTTCEDCGGTWLDYAKERIKIAKESNKDFVDIVLNSSGNRAGVTGYNDGVDSSDTHNLSRDNESLKGTVDGWTADGNTCICCGVNDAVDRLTSQSNESRFRSMVVMSDGEANVECSEQGTGSASEDAIQASCSAYSDHGIKVYTVGFGSDVDETTLQDMADCGHGEYYYSNISRLSDVYSLIAKDMMNASYEAQRVVTSGGDADNITLYPDSHMIFNYTEGNNELDYGEIPLTFKSDRFGGNITSPKKGSFYVGNGTNPLGARVTSYSSQYWTSLLNISNNIKNREVYNITTYGTDYTDLGDPYSVRIPSDDIGTGNNTVYIDTALNPTNRTGGSPDSRVIFELGVEGSVGYGDSFDKYQGGTVNITTESGEEYRISIGNSSDPWDPERDALDNMVERLLGKLDVDDDGKISIRLTSDNLEIERVTLSDVPFLWGPSVFTLKVW